MSSKHTLSIKKLRLHGRSPILLVLLLVVLLSGCASGAAEQPVAVTPTTTVEESAENAPALEKRGAQPATLTTIPVALSIPQIGLTTTVVEMGWIVTEVNGERTTRWEIPYSNAGWHVNSAGAGADGNMVISGHQVVGEAIFAPLALGEVEVGQEILVTDIREQVFRYDVVEVTEPIPLAGATEDEQALAASYVEPSTKATLTLVTGWPDFATTHYLFVVADYVGPVE